MRIPLIMQAPKPAIFARLLETCDTPYNVWPFLRKRLAKDDFLAEFASV